MKKEKVFNLRAFIVAGLRRLTYKYRPRYETMNEARVERGKYRCKKCNNIVGRKDIKLDHINPVIDPLIGFQTWDIYISRMFIGKEGWQALCVTCHKEKTKEEKQLKSKNKLTIKKKKGRM